MRIALGIEYDGANFSGWQSQKGLRTVQCELEKALSQVADEPVRIICAGRTDTGVHALEQVIHFNTTVDRPDSAWLLGTNTYLANDIAVLWVKKVSDEFHARYSAIKRHYRYIIHNRLVRSPLTRYTQTWHDKELNAEKMHEAAQYLLGENDFSSFRGADCQSKTPIRRVDEITVHRENELVIINIKANAFLYHMVRNIVGTLMLIGEGKQSPGWIREVLEAKDRKAAHITAPAAGLYLVKISYPIDF